jgi:exosortase A
MKVETERVLSAQSPADVPARAPRGWRIALPVVAGCIVLILAIHWRTAESLVAIWWRSETFAHGFLIAPITLWLVWLKRGELARLMPAADYLGLVLLAGASLAWLVAQAGQVQVVQQYAMTAMIPAAVIAAAGRRVALALAFPLAFLLLAVPVGEALVPPLMEWTADFTVAALQLSAIPVYREGLFFSIPSGNWSVVEGCSGLRYLIASVTVGALYAYLSYERLWKRALFVALSIAAPIVANGLRAYLIVMIAHLSDMKLALGIDHLIYGWVFFGLVMLLLFWIGSFWRDPLPEARHKGAAASGAGETSAPRMAGVAAAVLALAAAGPLYAAYLDRPSGHVPLLQTPAGAAGWTAAPARLTDWRPHYGGAAASLFEVYRKGDRGVALYLGYYRDQRQGAELVNSQNVMVVQKHPVWANVGEAARNEELGRGAMRLRQTQLRSAGQRLLVWDWYRISGRDLASPYLAKLYLAGDKLLGRGDDAAALIIAVPYDGGVEAAQETLREFARDMLPSIGAALAAAKVTR